MTDRVRTVDMSDPAVVLDCYRKLNVAYKELRAENEKLRAAGEGVVKWWLDEGCLPFDGAPYALFALRKALGHSRAKAALDGDS